MPGSGSRKTSKPIPKRYFQRTTFHELAVEDPEAKESFLSPEDPRKGITSKTDDMDGRKKKVRYI